MWRNLGETRAEKAKDNDQLTRTSFYCCLLVVAIMGPTPKLPCKIFYLPLQLDSSILTPITCLFISSFRIYLFERFADIINETISLILPMLLNVSFPNYWLLTLLLVYVSVSETDNQTLFSFTLTLGHLKRSVEIKWTWPDIMIHLQIILKPHPSYLPFLSLSNACNLGSDINALQYVHVYRLWIQHIKMTKIQEPFVWGGFEKMLFWATAC